MRTLYSHRLQQTLNTSDLKHSGTASESENPKCRCKEGEREICVLPTIPDTSQRPSSELKITDVSTLSHDKHHLLHGKNRVVLLICTRQNTEILRSSTTLHKAIIIEFIIMSNKCKVDLGLVCTIALFTFFYFDIVNIFYWVHPCKKNNFLTIVAFSFAS